MPRSRLHLAALVALLAAAPFAGAPAQAQTLTPKLAPDDHVLGDAAAPITVFEYASLTCPHCGDFDRLTLPQIKKNWIDTGHVKFVYRDYPLDGVALHAAVIAQCAPRERFFGFVDAMFQTQEKWVLAPNPDVGLKAIAKLGGMSEEQFDACAKDGALTDKVVAERLAGQKDYGVEGTPTFFVNGTKVVGEKPYSEWEKTLTAALPPR